MEYSNWDIFRYEEQLWTLGIPRDEDYVELVPSAKIGEVTEIPRSEWEQFTIPEFAELVDQGTIEPAPEENPLNL